MTTQKFKTNDNEGSYSGAARCMFKYQGTPTPPAIKTNGYGTGEEFGYGDSEVNS